MQIKETDVYIEVFPIIRKKIKGSWKATLYVILYNGPCVRYSILIQRILCARTVALFQVFCMSNDFPPRVVST